MRILIFLLSKPKLTLVCLLVISMLMALGISKLEVRNNFDGELPQDDPVITGFNLVQDHFDKRSAILFGIEAEDIYNKQSLIKVMEMTDAVKGLPSVLKDEIKSLSTVQSLSSEDWGIDTSGFLDDLSSANFDIDELRSQIAENHMVNGKLVSSDGRLAVIIANLDDDFNGAEVFQGAQEIRDRFQGPEIIH
ncbi:MAG: hypothetical protein HKO90_08475, partial [Flavobacteriaceae bacterium]|nr:hypothetical protein [Flavobacteriaceae bacterium]